MPPPPPPLPPILIPLAHYIYSPWGSNSAIQGCRGFFNHYICYFFLLIEAFKSKSGFPGLPKINLSNRESILVHFRFFTFQWENLLSSGKQMSFTVVLSPGHLNVNRPYSQLAPMIWVKPTMKFHIQRNFKWYKQCITVGPSYNKPLSYNKDPCITNNMYSSAQL